MPEISLIMSDMPRNNHDRHYKVKKKAD